MKATAVMNANISNECMQPKSKSSRNEKNIILNQLFFSNTYDRNNNYKVKLEREKEIQSLEKSKISEKELHTTIKLLQQRSAIRWTN